MKGKFYLYLSLLLWIFSIRSAGCNCSKGDPCEYEGKCGLVYIKGEFSNTSDTMFVGDSLILDITIPDYYSVIKEGDTALVSVSAFKNQTISFGLQIIDSTMPNKVNYIGGKLLVGQAGHHLFTTEYPYRYKILYVLDKTGVYFFQTGRESVCNINGSAFITRVVLEWDVPFKNFELMRPLGDTNVSSAILSDADDILNYFLFEVIEK